MEEKRTDFKEIVLGQVSFIETMLFHFGPHKEEHHVFSTLCLKNLKLDELVQYFLLPI